MGNEKIRIEHILGSDRTGDGDKLVTMNTGDSLNNGVPLELDADGNAVSTPTKTGNSSIYVTHDAGGTTTGNLPAYDSNGNLTDSGAASSGASVSIWDQILTWYADNSADSMDHKITSGEFVALIFHKFNSTSGWSSPTNATHTVATGKKLLLIYNSPSLICTANGDPTNRKMRTRNTTDGTNLGTEGPSQAGTPFVSGDSSGTGAFPQAAAGKVVQLQLWNNGTTPRQMGGFVICKEITA